MKRNYQAELKLSIIAFIAIVILDIYLRYKL